MSERPNFLFIMTDQQRADWLGCAGHPVVQTPHIDALAARGTRFDGFSVASPICSPNRASFMTGRTPSVHGLRYNGLALSENASTFVQALAGAGYDTAAVGKSHLQPFLSMPAVHPPDADTRERPVAEAWAETGTDYGHELAERYEGPGRYEIPTPYYGFDHVDMLTGHGDRCGGHYAQWFREQLPDWQVLLNPANELPHDYECPQAIRTPVPAELYSTTWVADRAIDFLDAPDRSNAPFFAFVSFPDPHHPFNPPGKYWDMYSPDQFAVTLPYEAHHNPPPPMQWMQHSYEAGGGQATRQTAFRTDDRAIREAMALTAGMITMIDDHVGRLVERLRANGQFDNTVICFTSDHGDYLGDFGFLLKGVLPFRSITEVPMIWSDPTAPNAQVVDTLASTIDIGPTVLDRADLATFRGTQGMSFLPTIRTGAAHRDEVLIEYNQHMIKFGFADKARLRTLRTCDWRFTLYAGHEWGELYDLRSDPHETHNLWDSPDHRSVRGDLALRLADHLTRQMDESPRSEQLA